MTRVKASTLASHHHHHRTDPLSKKIAAKSARPHIAYPSKDGKDAGGHRSRHQHKKHKKPREKIVAVVERQERDERDKPHEPQASASSSSSSSSSSTSPVDPAPAAPKKSKKPRAEPKYRMATVTRRNFAQMRKHINQTILFGPKAQRTILARAGHDQNVTGDKTTNDDGEIRPLQFSPKAVALNIFYAQTIVGRCIERAYNLRMMELEEQANRWEANRKARLAAGKSIKITERSPADQIPRMRATELEAVFRSYCQDADPSVGLQYKMLKDAAQ